MVHKKYIKVNGKTYGPYYYKSYREDGKVKKKYLKGFSEFKEDVGNLASIYPMVYIFVIVFILGITFELYLLPLPTFNIKTNPSFLLSPAGASSGFIDNANLTIWDDSDKLNKFSECVNFCGQKNKPFPNLWNVIFYSNYTDKSGNVIDNLNGDCMIKFDLGGGFGNYQDMNYDPVDFVWKYNSIFNVKGLYTFEVNCDSSYGNVTILNDFEITNTKPYIIQSPEGFIDLDIDGVKNTLNCVEDKLCVYNFSSNVSEDDLNDILGFGYSFGANTTLNNFSIDSKTGVLNINVTNDINSGQRKVELTVVDSESPTISALLDVFITPVNDVPFFVNLKNMSFNMSELFNYVILAEDEEENVPFSFNISFLNCKLAQWSNRTDCILFNNSMYSVNSSSINISFIPTRNDVGVYLVNFSVKDNNSLVMPYNTSLSVVVNFSVFNINSYPYFDYICDKNREGLEDSNFFCKINATDVDEINGLSFMSNVSWFLDFKSIVVNSTTNFSGSINISFIPSDYNVGNWSINISVIDSGSPKRINSTIINFYFGNVNDSVKLQKINDVVEYTSNNYHAFYINASDEDLLIQDKNVYDENLVFSSNFSCVSVRSLGVIDGTNVTEAIIEFNPSDINCFVSGEIYNVNISVVDANKYSIDSDVFSITVIGNNPPVWDINMAVEYSLIEDVVFYLNLSKNVSDAEGDSLVFSYVSDNLFPSFSLNSLTGLINFVPVDVDVGQHIVNITVSDMATPVELSFNFSVFNINDAPFIERPLTGNSISIDVLNSNMNTTEDANVEIFLMVDDDDLKIPLNQKSFYNESFNFDLNINGPNSSLFNFSKGVFVFPNKYLFETNFVPRKSDIGSYEINVNISDSSSQSDSINFNLSIREINHPPVLENIYNQTSAVGFNLYYDINASDVEEGSDSSGNLSYSYRFLSGSDFIKGDNSIFNRSSGVLNITFNSTQGGIYDIEIIVNDSFGLKDIDDFWIFVYDLPSINSPDSGHVFDFVEGVGYNLSFNVSHIIGDNLTYEFYIDSSFRKGFSYYGDGSNFSWIFIPNYTDESYGNFRNLSLFVFVEGFEELNVSRSWNINISHNNSPIVFYRDIGDKQANVGGKIIINLSEHFYDFDAFDPYYNQSFVFNLSHNFSSGISWSFDDWILVVSSEKETSDLVNVSGSDLDINNVSLTSSMSNNFIVKFVSPIKVEVPLPSSGGGGGSSNKQKPISLKIITPEPISVKKGGIVNIPIKVVNDGPFILESINLSSFIAKSGIIRDDMNLTLSKDFIYGLAPGEEDDFNLTVLVDTEELGLYEVTLNATVKNPSYSDWGKIFINVEEGQTVKEKLVFTEEFIVENPECIELKELVDESKQFLSLGDFDSASSKLDEAVNGCKEAISRQSIFSRSRIRAKFQDRVFVYLLIASFVSIILGIAYYIYRRILFKKILESTRKINSENKFFNVEENTLK